LSAPSSEVAFVDTNVLASAHDASEVARQPVAGALVSELWRTRSGALSTQVLQKFYVVASRTFDPPMPQREARDLVDVYGHWNVVEINVPLIIAASQLEERHGLSFGALIVEAARRAGATRLLTEDLQPGRRIAGMLIDNPSPHKVSVSRGRGSPTCLRDGA
jgi:predicted nucleic acid-binding protein